MIIINNVTYFVKYVCNKHKDIICVFVTHTYRPLPIPVVHLKAEKE